MTFPEYDAFGKATDIGGNQKTTANSDKRRLKDIRKLQVDSAQTMKFEEN
jgi:hypothetical protein